MAVVIITDLPAEAGTEMYDTISSKVGVEEDPPDGMIVHAASKREDGGIRIVDVWESTDHWDRFREDRLLPVFREVVPTDDGSEPDREIHEVHHLVKP